MPKKNKEQGLGKALQNKLDRKFHKGTGEKAPMFYQESQQNEADVKKMKMQSVLEQNSLSEFLQAAQMSQKDFHANRDVKFREIREEVRNKKIISMDEKGEKEVAVEELDYAQLLKGIQMPRRPQWQKAPNKQALEQAQNEAYLNWRRQLAKVEEKYDQLTITPYEKNLQVWRQLWRVVDRADVLVQIVDGRHPLFFYSSDLINYAQEMGKKNFLLVVNKSDLIEPEAISKWNQYFKSKDIQHVFFAAKEGVQKESEQEITINSETVLSPHQLAEVFDKFAEDRHIEVGLTGYPNVGKSSVINALIGRKKVGVASMPGKTKHFQTLKLTQKVTLCDCPGLVFPKISETKAEMLLNGLYPVDTFKQYQAAVDLLVYRIPQEKLSKQYGVHWKETEPYDGQSLLAKSATIRGFWTGNGLPNSALAARNILKDYVNGAIVYCHLPPGSEGDKPSFKQKQAQINLQKANFAKKQEKTQMNLDTEFFEKEQGEVLGLEETVSLLQEDDFLDIVEGKNVEGIRVTKMMRKQIKHHMKRGGPIQQLRQILLGSSGKDRKKLIRN